MSEVVKLERHDEVGIVTVNSPPVNALSAAVRGGILECIKAAIADEQGGGDRGLDRLLVLAAHDQPVHHRVHVSDLRLVEIEDRKSVV